MITSGVIDINQRDSTGATPLIYATWHGSSGLVRVLLERGADTAAVNASGFTALHVGAMRGDPGPMGLLLEAGADIEKVEPSTGTAPLHMAAQMGHYAVIDVLVSAGANVDKQAINGETPLYMAASRGEAGAVSTLLLAEADPLVAHCRGVTPLEIAVREEHYLVVHALLNYTGVEGCGGVDDGRLALECAAEQRETSILEMLSEGGVIDTLGTALCSAITLGLAQSVKFLLQAPVPHYKVIDVTPEFRGAMLQRDDIECYVNIARGPRKHSAVECCFKESSLGLSSGRILRMLVDAGLDLTSDAVRILLSVADDRIHEREEGTGYDSMNEKVLGLKGLRRILLQQPMLRTALWRWPTREVDAARPSATIAASTATSSTQLRRMQPILRRRAGRRSALLAALFRYILLRVVCLSALAAAAKKPINAKALKAKPLLPYARSQCHFQTGNATSSMRRSWGTSRRPAMEMRAKAYLSRWSTASFSATIFRSRACI